jgi:hypothetical protein
MLRLLYPVYSLYRVYNFNRLSHSLVQCKRMVDANVVQLTAATTPPVFHLIFEYFFLLTRLNQWFFSRIEICHRNQTSGQKQRARTCCVAGARIPTYRLLPCHH